MLTDEQIKVMIDQDTLEERIKTLGKEITKDYAGKEILMVCILKGAVMFMTQLAKSIERPFLGLMPETAL